MFLIIAFVVICIGTAIAVFRSDKPARQILAEARYELIYSVLGSKSLVEDFLMRNKNTTDFPEKAGKVAVITGGTRGIGLEVVKMLLKCDLNVIIGCRNVDVGESLLEKFRAQGITTGDLKAYKLDVSRMESVKEFAAIVGRQYPKIHILINNAGIMYVPFSETEDGFESHLATNYLGHFLLTHLLLKQLKAGGEKGANSRIVNVTSVAHERGVINFDDISLKNDYIPYAAYSQSKLAQILFSNYVNKIMKEQEQFVESYSVHPGIVDTELFDNTYLKKLAPWAIHLFFKSPEKGAIPIVFTGVSAKLEDKGGSYVSNCRRRTPSALALSGELQEKLFEFTKELLKIEEF